MVKKYIAFYYEKNLLRIQKSQYIEHGYYIDIIKDKIILFEIPYGGGEPIAIGNFTNILDAIKTAEEII